MTGALVVSAVQGVHIINTREYGSDVPICRVETSKRVVALSFDDGPDDAYTPEILRVLGEHGARATFFLVGEHAISNQGLVHQEVRAGMEMANHTWSHPHLDDISTEHAMSELQRTTELRSSFGASVTLFRAPYGEVSADLLRAIRADGTLTPVHWSFPIDEYLESADLEPREAAEAIAAEAQPGDIILAHDSRDGGVGRESTVATLRLLLPRLKIRGFRVVSVGELMTLGSPVRAKPRAWFWQSGFACGYP